MTEWSAEGFDQKGVSPPTIGSTRKTIMRLPKFIRPHDLQRSEAEGRRSRHRRENEIYPPGAEIQDVTDRDVETGLETMREIRELYGRAQK